jgi:hypothetical protein
MNDVEKTGKSLPKELESVDSSMADLGGMGTESVNQANVETPRLKILEAQSPQVMKGKDRLSDAEIGDFCKTDTGDLWRGEVTVIPCDFHNAATGLMRKRYLDDWQSIRLAWGTLCEEAYDALPVAIKA